MDSSEPYSNNESPSEQLNLMEQNRANGANTITTKYANETKNEGPASTSSPMRGGSKEETKMQSKEGAVE